VLPKKLVLLDAKISVGGLPFPHRRIQIITHSKIGEWQMANSQKGKAMREEKNRNTKNTWNTHQNRRSTKVNTQPFVVLSGVVWHCQLGIEKNL
jgi:hypothetical protein